MHNAIEKENQVLSVVNYAGKAIDHFYLNRNFLKLKYTNIQHRDTTYLIKCLVPSAPRDIKRFGKKVYLSFYNKIAIIDEKKQIKYIPFNAIVLSFIKDKDNHLWVGSYGNGLFEFDENDSLVNHYFENKTINNVYFDLQNSLWVSTEGFGIFLCKRLNEFHYTSGDFSEKPYTFIKQLGSKLLLANNASEIFIYENKRFTKISKDNVIVGEVLDINENRDYYYVSSRMNTVQISKVNYSNFEVSVLDNKKYSYRVKCFGNDTIIYLLRKDIIILAKNKILLQISSKYKLYDFELRNNHIVLATDDGIFEIVDNSIVRPNYLNASSKCIVTKIVKGKFGELWFCTKGSGIFKLDRKNVLKSYKVGNGLPSNFVNDISFNTNHSILLSTNQGLYISSKYKRWLELYSGQVKSAVESKNDIYFITNNGLILIKKSNQILASNFMSFNLESVNVNGKLTNDRQLTGLAHFQNNFEFNFDIISFSSGISDIVYQLKGPKSFISITKNQQIVFQNLTPGCYTLTAALAAGSVESQAIIIPFSITPAIWQTTWFLAICVFLLIGICAFFVWLSVNYYKKKENKKNEVSRLIAEYKLMAVKAQINPHFMSNCLTAIQNLILSGKVDEANRYLAKFSLLVRQILNFSSKSLVSVKEELEIIELNIELEQLRFESKFSFQIELHDSMDLNEISIPPLILQPVIENAIWHGLLPLKKLREGRLKIVVEKNDRALLLIIEDNGVGRNSNKINLSNSRDSKGIQLIIQRIESVNYLHNSSIGNLVFEDLYDADKNPSGLRVIITLPLLLKDLYDDKNNHY